MEQKLRVFEQLAEFLALLEESRAEQLRSCMESAGNLHARIAVKTGEEM